MVKASYRVDTIEVAISFRICVFNSASCVHFRVLFCSWRRFSLDLREFDYAVKLIWRKPSGQNKIFIGERSSASSLRIEWYSYLPLMFRWSKVVQFFVWPFDFPDFVGRALHPRTPLYTLSGGSTLCKCMCARASANGCKSRNAMGEIEVAMFIRRAQFEEARALIA